MKYMLLMKYEGGAACDVPMGEWAPEDINTSTSSAASERSSPSVGSWSRRRA